MIETNLKKDFKKESERKAYFEAKTDFELFSQYIKNPKAEFIDVKTALHTLWKRYEPLTHKMGHILEARKAKGNFFGLDTETYFSDSYDTFLKAVNGIKIDKIDPAKYETWKFWIQYNGYLRTANRDKINAYCKLTKNERPITVYNEDGEELLITDLNPSSDIVETTDESFFKNEESMVLRDAIKNACKKFKPNQMKIWQMRENGETFTSIAKSMGVSSSSIKYQMNSIKEILKEELKNSNKKFMSDVSIRCLN